MKKEQVIVSLTTWHERIANLPVVLDSIYAQTYQPDKVVLNLAYDEAVPEDVKAYLKNHNVEVNSVQDTKVYKKIIPTLRKYPEACVINIDDDSIYPSTMIADFVEMHKQYPKFPISGNRVVLYGMQCHCGLASLTKAEYFGEWLDKIDTDLMQHCSSSDIVFTYMATRNGHPYIHTKEEYFKNIQLAELEGEAYSSQVVKEDGVGKSYNYLVQRYGEPESPMRSYVGDECIAETIDHILREEVKREIEEVKERTEKKIRSSKSYRLGKALLKPIRALKR